MPLSRRFATFLAGLVLLGLSGLGKADVFDQLTAETRKIINESLIPNAEVRQCTCEEQSECIGEMKTQAMACVDSCWSTFNKITEKPEELRKCFHERDDMLGTLLDCFEHNVDSCLATQNESVKIQPVDIEKMFTLGVQHINKTKDKMTRTLSASIKRIIDTVGDFGLCVKDCFVEKNRAGGGFCFDRRECQPLLGDKKTRKSLKTCTKKVDWKKEAGELCECTVRAGLSELSQYCPMLKLIGSRGRGGRKG